jgi:hypothetical protein
LQFESEVNGVSETMKQLFLQFHVKFSLHMMIVIVLAAYNFLLTFSILFQCQSQLKTLYAEGIEGCHMEFAAYNLLCVILHSNNHRDLVSLMSRLVTFAE